MFEACKADTRLKYFELAWAGQADCLEPLRGRW